MNDVTRYDKLVRRLTDLLADDAELNTLAHDFARKTLEDAGIEVPGIGDDGLDDFAPYWALVSEVFSTVIQGIALRQSGIHAVRSIDGEPTENFVA